MRWNKEEKNIYSEENEDFGCKLYFSTAKEKAKYKTPLIPLRYVKSIRKKGEIQLTIEIEPKTDLILTKNLLMNYNNLCMNWLDDNNLFEVLYDEVKFYLDIEYEFISKEHDKNILDTIIILLNDVLKVKILYSDCAISYGTGKITHKETKETYIKASFHIIINNDYKVRNNKELNDIKDVIEYYLNNKNDYEILRNGLNNKSVIDFNVYHSNQQFKLPNQTKLRNKKYGYVKQNIISDKKELKHFLIKDVREQKQYYKIEELTKTYHKEKQQNPNNNILCEDDYILKIPKDYKIMLEKYKNNIGDYKIDIEKLEKEEDKLRYHLLSIPNNKEVCKRIFLFVSYCIKTIENKEKRKDGLKLLTEWTKQYDKTITQKKLSQFYNNLHIKGYGYNVLYYFARIYNKNIDKYNPVNCLFNEEPKNINGEKWKIIKVKDKYLSDGLVKNKQDIINLYNKNDIIYIKSPLGTGKTKIITDIMNKISKETTILYISCKRSFAGSVMSDILCKYGFISYLDCKDNQNSIKDIKRLLISVESGKYCDFQYDLVIIDEIETIRTNITSKTNIENKPIENLDKIHSIMQSSKKIILMDAFLTSSSFDLTRNIIKYNMKKKKLLYIKNEYIPKKRHCIFKKGKMEDLYDFLTFNMLKRLKKGCNIVFNCGSNDLIKNKFMLDDRFKDYKTLIYNKENKLDNNINVDKEWIKDNVRILIYTPTISAGISFNIKGYYDNLFIYSSNSDRTALIRDFMQSMARVRHFKDDKIYLGVNNNSIIKYDKTPITIQEIKEQEEKQKVKLFINLYDKDKEKGEREIIERNDIKEEYNFYWQLHLFNILERNINTRCNIELWQEYLKESNIEIINNLDEEELEKNNIEEQINYNTYDNIKDITDEEYETIQEKYNKIYDKKNTEKIIILDEEKEQYQKYKYVKKTKKELTEKEKKEYYDTIMIKKESIIKEKDYLKFMNTLEKHNYNYKDIMKEFKKDDIDIYKELTRETAKEKRKYILRLFMHCKIIYKDGLCYNKRISEKDLKKCFDKDLKELFKEDYKEGIKQINSMLNNERLKPNKKQEVNYLSIYNNLLKDLFNVKLIHKQTRGKNKKLINYYLLSSSFKECKNPFEIYNIDYKKQKELIQQPILNF